LVQKLHGFRKRNKTRLPGREGSERIEFRRLRIAVFGPNFGPEIGPKKAGSNAVKPFGNSQKTIGNGWLT
jgi:hypothetical protein